MSDISTPLSAHTGLMNTVVDCLQDLNLTQFQSQLANEPDLNAALQSDTRQFTIFAPSDEAFDQLSDIQQLLLFSGLARRQTLEAHIANKTIPTKKFIEGAVIRPLEQSTLLHITKFERWQRFLRRYSVVCTSMQLLSHTGYFSFFLGGGYTYRVDMWMISMPTVRCSLRTQ